MRSSSKLQQMALWRHTHPQSPKQIQSSGKDGRTWSCDERTVPEQPLDRFLRTAGPSGCLSAETEPGDISKGTGNRSQHSEFLFISSWVWMSCRAWNNLSESVVEKTAWFLGNRLDNWYWKKWCLVLNAPVKMMPRAEHTTSHKSKRLQPLQWRQWVYRKKQRNTTIPKGLFYFFKHVVIMLSF